MNKAKHDLESGEGQFKLLLHNAAHSRKRNLEIQGKGPVKEKEPLFRALDVCLHPWDEKSSHYLLLLTLRLGVCNGHESEGGLSLVNAITLIRLIWHGLWLEER
ncbi:hypothetical protein AVEN_255862-1 [Araneus ventricosus]|uniref:Uncharacterized protein n=1 Tax=Araneus ventricosus TaxID=182803 RepID=A0A4Y2ENL5_ARAVE|nr:hypothetical protein AVEN_255862-1 [Araneus ventricosus]